MSLSRQSNKTTRNSNKYSHMNITQSSFLHNIRAYNNRLITREKVGRGGRVKSKPPSTKSSATTAGNYTLLQQFIAQSFMRRLDAMYTISKLIFMKGR